MKRPRFSRFHRNPTTPPIVSCGGSSWDSYIEVRGNRYGDPSRVGQSGGSCADRARRARVYQDEQLVAAHQLQSASAGWVTVPEHHTTLWRDALAVEQQRPLEVYEEVGQWN